MLQLSIELGDSGNVSKRNASSMLTIIQPGLRHEVVEVRYKATLHILTRGNRCIRQRADPRKSDTANSIRKHVSENRRIRVASWEVSVKPWMLPVRYLCRQIQTTTLVSTATTTCRPRPYCIGPNLLHIPTIRM